MPWALLETWAKTAGVAGVSIGAVVFIFYQIIQKVPSPNVAQSAKLLRLMIILIFTIGVLGILTYLGIIVFVPEKDRMSYEVKKVTDVLDFSEWKAPRPGKPALVVRHRQMVIHRAVSKGDDFVDRITTTGDGVSLDRMSNVASFSEVPPKSGRSRHDYLLTVPNEVFDEANTYELDYVLTYANGWRHETDDWVGKVMQYPTRDYTYKLKFPSKWNVVRVVLQPPGAALEQVMERKRNSTGSLTYEWSSGPKRLLKPGTRLVVYFDWPPLGSVSEHL